ncbi:melanoma-associated antigen 1-like [Capricornis sumatraensis]|uniref:melanoma-associated antigen 1-like n=1 Tax=Capricornis sumatraensis TaxID=34865 RepID=UPI0036044ECE
MEAQCVGGEEEEEEMEVEQEEEQVKKGDAASSSFCLPAWGTLEEVAAAATVSLPQSPLGVCLSPTAVAATLGSQSEYYGLSRQEEVPSTSHDQEDTKSSLPNALQVKKNELVEFLLKYLQLVFGLEVKEVDPSEHTYILVPTLGLTLNEMLRDGQGLPKPSFLVVILCLIAVEDDRAPEEIWRTLRRMEVCPRREHYIFGEPRELLTQVWVQEGYLEYQQVPDGDPGCYEFLWGP